MRLIDTLDFLPFLLLEFTVAYPHNCYPSCLCLPPGHINYGSMANSACSGGVCQYFCLHCECCIYRCSCPNTEEPTETTQQTITSYEIKTARTTPKVPRYHNSGRAHSKKDYYYSTVKPDSSESSKSEESTVMEFLNTIVTGTTLMTDSSGSNEQALNRSTSDISEGSEVTSNILEELGKKCASSLKDNETGESGMSSDVVINEFKNSTYDSSFSSDHSTTQSTVTESIKSTISGTLKITDFVYSTMTQN
ncbi:unnamed protein product [Hymenolepis diminuta]|uniref:Uncharacterized protein n=1 Tax=Hymenolepis diminuta TaxID=6216 RepID=A0A564YJ59_HYMDI|nr:unnamed protein product [Hymenolepis diminuta]